MSEPVTVDFHAIHPHRCRVRIIFDGRGWFVNHPHYLMVPGSWEPVTKGLIHKDGVYPDADPATVEALKPTVEVDIPCRTADHETGLPDKGKIRALYKGQPDWDHDKVTDDLEAQPSKQPVRLAERRRP
jgi:hypothetical protein